MWSALRRALENPRILSQNIQAVQKDLATDYQSMVRERQKFVRSILDTVVVAGDKATITGTLSVASEPRELSRSLDVGPLP